MKILVGLGNPGRKYLHNRHNVGFMVMDRLAEKEKVIFRRSFILKGYIASKNSKDDNFVLVKPATFMNNSGECLRRIIRRYECKPQEMLVVYDDVDLAQGRMRLRAKGSSGGHRGMQSIISALHTEDIPRLRIGIGHPDKGDIAEYVLSDFSESEMQTMEKVLNLAVECCRDWLDNDIQDVMAKYNR